MTILSDKHKAAIAAYMRHNNKKQACLDAGYSEWSVPDIFNHPDVVAEIKRRQEQTAANAGITREYLLGKLKTIIDAEPGEMLEVDNKGKVSINYKNLSPSLRKAIRKFEVVETKGAKKYSKTKTQVKFDVPDIIAAIKEAGVLTGIREEKTQINTDMDLVKRLDQGIKRVGTHGEGDSE